MTDMTKLERKACKHLINRSSNNHLIDELVHVLIVDWKLRHPILTKLGLPYFMLGVE